VIDLRSDTVTRPDEAMRTAARDAEVGDDVYGDDPTVNELERRAAELVGMDAALFVPTGTMGNQVAVRTHTRRGGELLCESQSHIYEWELGGVAQHSGVQARPVDGGPRGVVSAEQVTRMCVEGDDHHPATHLVCLENTHNARGGLAIAPEALAEAAAAAHDHGVRVHLDGARLFNAAVALGEPATRLTSEVDSVLFCLSKGLGAPIGSVLAGSESFIDRARHHRKLFGGGMRQAGLVAAPGLVALENRDRLAEDHRHARRLADGLETEAGLEVQSPETNIILVDVEESAERFLERCRDAGVDGMPFDDRQVRFCTHWDVGPAAIDRAIGAVATVT
jgi:threonine aldolase